MKEEENSMKKVVKLENLDCANCAAKMEDGVSKISGVEKVTVSFLMQKMTIIAPEEQMEDILKQAEKVIHKVEPDVVLKL
jgi:cation transport ATPase